MTIGEYHYEDSDDAYVPCDCGHTVLCNQAEEIWTEAGKVQLICDACFFAQH